MVWHALASFTGLVAWFIVPATVVAVVMRSTVVAGRVDSWLDDPCPDCDAQPREECHWACSSHWS